MAETKPLTHREWEVVELLLQGKSNKLIALALGISERTVEFHLKNIYAKSQVNSRVELILKLGTATGTRQPAKLGDSTVEAPAKSAENRDTPCPHTGWGASFRDSVSVTGKELEMKNLLNTRHVPAGVITTFVTGFTWVALLQRFGHMSLAEIEPWVLPLVLVLALIGFSVGLAGKRSGNTPWKVSFGALFGTGVGAFAMLPLTVIIVVPLGKLAEWLGLVDRAAMPGDVASTLVTIAMLGMWLLVGAAIGTGLLYLTIKKPAPPQVQRQASEHGL